MNTNSLQIVESALKQRGVRDVKFLIKREAVAVPMTDLEEDLADVLNKFLAGEHVVADKLPRCEAMERPK
jgi:hypothetical protein